MGKRGLQTKSCNLCRARKIKCDREGSRNATCTFCAEREVVCVLEADRNRSRQVAASSAASTSHLNTAFPSFSSPSTIASLGGIHSSSDEPRSFRHTAPDAAVEDSSQMSAAQQPTSTWDADEYFAQILASPLPIPPSHQSSLSLLASSAAVAVSPITQLTTQPRGNSRGGLFNVQGLTRSVLDESVTAFFTFVNPYLPILDATRFWPRYHAYFAQFSAGNFVNREGVEEEEPLSLLLILATAIKGVGHTHIPNKFELQRRAFDKFLSQCREGDSLAEDGLDALEALLLFHSEETPPPDPKKPLTMHPLETEFLIKLGHMCKVHERSDDVETARRRAVISTMTIVYDALSIRRGTLYLIKEEDIDAEIVAGECLSEDRMEWLQSLRSLALLARSNARQLFSSSVKRQGVIAQDIEAVVGRTQAVYRSLPRHYRWPPVHEREAWSLTLPQAIFSALFMEQLAIIQGCIEECGWDMTRARSSDHQRAEQSLQSGLREAYLETVDVAQKGSQLGFYNLCVPALRNAAAGCAKYAMTSFVSEDAEAEAERSPLSGATSLSNSLPLSHALHGFPRHVLELHVRILLDAVKTATSFADTVTLSSALESEYKVWQTSSHAMIPSY